MKYPDYLNGNTTFMTLPKSYQEYFIRFYYYNNTEQTNIPDTIPVENIEDYLVHNCTGCVLWNARGFASARNVDAGDNLDFKNDCEFSIVIHYIAKLWYKAAIENKWINENISEKDFEEECIPLSAVYTIPL